MVPDLICCKCHAELSPNKYCNITVDSPDPELSEFGPSTIRLCSKCFSELRQLIFFGYVEDSCEF